jgi:hypothetical protein
MTMIRDPFAKEIPEPGDFDEYIETLRPEELVWHEPNPHPVRIRIIRDASEVRQPPAVSR